MRNSSSRWRRPYSSRSAGDLGERARLEDVLEVGVPEPDPAEADARGVCAAVAQVEEAPLASDVHVDGPGRRPVERDQVVGCVHREER